MWDLFSDNDLQMKLILVPLKGQQSVFYGRWQGQLKTINKNTLEKNRYVKKQIICC
jgi:hypothetical protein